MPSSVNKEKSLMYWFDVNPHLLSDSGQLGNRWEKTLVYSSSFIARVHP